MTDTDDKQTLIDADELTATVIDPRLEAKGKQLTELTLDQIIQYRSEELFNKRAHGATGEERRQSFHRLYADNHFYRCNRIVGRKHVMQKSGIRFVAIEVGILRICSHYAGELEEISKLVERVDGDGESAGDLEMLKVMSIAQEGSLKESKIGFTQADSEWISDLADEVGIRVSTLMLVAYWIAVLTCTYLPEDTRDYGEGIIKKFEKLLKMRRIQLQQIAPDYIHNI